MPPPVEELDDLADRLNRESVDEEFERMQIDPISVLEERDKPGLGEVSKVTKMLVAQAGVPSKGRRLGITLLGIFGSLGLVGAVIYLAVVQGWISEKSSGKNSDLVLANEANLGLVSDGTNPEDQPGPRGPSRLRSILWDVSRPAQKKEPKSSVGRPRPGTDLNSPASVPLTKREKELMTFYEQQDDKREVAPLGPRGVPTPTGPLSIDMPGGYNPMVDLKRSESKVEVVPSGPDIRKGPDQLSEHQVSLVVKRHYKKVKSCLERQLKRDASISGKMYVVARVKPNGKVKDVRISTPKFHGTFVEECLIKEVNRWQFPTFDGKTYDLHFPLLLSAQQTY
ncbi:MAG: AgmX/PglI C-terminal domain-containing protein [Deltaproteobacteria bacterium]|nr:AgmX/PglI C-terminal domain-containing protein [Deltaproteobacteria bacterium]